MVLIGSSKKDTIMTIDEINKTSDDTIRLISQLLSSLTHTKALLEDAEAENNALRNELQAWYLAHPETARRFIERDAKGEATVEGDANENG